MKSSIRSGRAGRKILTAHAAVLYRCWSSGSPSRARAALLRPACRLLLSPTAPPSQHTIFTGPRSLSLPPRPWPWQSQTHMTFMRSPGLSLRVGVSTSVDTAGEVLWKHTPLYKSSSPASTREGRGVKSDHFLSITEVIHCHFCCSTEIWKSLLKFADLFLQSWGSVSELSTQ